MFDFCFIQFTFLFDYIYKYLLPWDGSPHIPEKLTLNALLFTTDICPHYTQMSDELLGNLHPLEQLLQEAIGEPLLYGRDVRLHVLQTPGGRRPARQSYTQYLRVMDKQDVLRI